MQTCCIKFSDIQKYWEHVVCLSKGQESGNLTQMDHRKGGEGYPFLQYPPKASIWVPNTMCKHAAPHSAAPKCTGDMLFVFQKGKSHEINPDSSIKASSGHKKEEKDILLEVDESAKHLAHRLAMVNGKEGRAG